MGSLPWAVLLLSAFGAGLVNALAGGGTLLSFPALLWVGLDAKLANATSTVALWPGFLGGVFGFRREIQAERATLLRLLWPSLLGGVLGALLLQVTPSDSFRGMVPFLIWTATALFALQGLLRPRHASAEGAPVQVGPLGYGMQFVGALYGGYFGAGLGIILLATLRACGMEDLQRANALKAVLGGLINGTAVLTFGLAGLVQWHLAAGMALAALLGGYAGARLSQRIGKVWVQRAVILLGLGLGLLTLF